MKILDHGYLTVIEHWGSDERIVEAARMSTGKGFLGWGGWKCKTCGIELDRVQSHTSKPGEHCENWHHHPDEPDLSEWEKIPRDEKLLRTLWENKHATPFEMAGLVVEVQAPIFVFREWHRHRTQSYNEMSARYIPLPDVNYVPSLERLMLGAQPTGNKQAGTVAGAAALTERAAERFREAVSQSYEDAERLYQHALREGVPKELARIHLPVGRYSRMRASANLRNWLAFLTLRNHPAAQYEIRQYAAALQGELATLFPHTLALFAEGRP